MANIKKQELEKNYPSFNDLDDDAKEKVLAAYNKISKDEPEAAADGIFEKAMKSIEDAEQELAEDYKLPQGAINNAKKVLEWKEKYGDEVKGMTEVGWKRARQLSKGGSVSIDTVKKMAQFNRHRENAKIDPKFKETPWKDNGHVAWLGWGGDAGIDWALGITQNLHENIHYVCLLGEDVEQSNTSIIEILRVGKVHDRGLSITKSMLHDFVKNFEDNVYGTDLQINLSHNRDGEAAGWVKKLFVTGDVLLAEVEWTPLGVDKIQKKQFKFTSSEFASSFPHFKTGEKFRNVLIGVALTNIPAVKGMNAVTLSENAENYINNHNVMDTLRQLYVGIMTSEEINEDDLKKFQEEAEAAKADEDSKEEVEKMEKSVEEKTAEPEEEEKAEEAPEEEKGEEEELAEKAEVVSLAEHNALKEKLDKIELSEDVKQSLLLSEGNSVGFVKDDVESVVGFMMNLSEEQRAQFKEIVTKVRSVNLSEIGGNPASGATSKLNPENVVELAEKILEKGEASDITEAQKLAVKQLRG